MRKRSRPDRVDRTSPEYVREVALRLLARREHSRKELQWKLLGRELPADAVDTVLEALEADNLLSDGRFAEVYVRSRAECGYGPHRLRAELRERGVTDSLIETALAASEIDWEQQAVRYYRRRFGTTPPKDWKEAAKRRRSMEQHGYTPEQIRTAVNDSGEE